jgi:hypothetical protein
MGNSMASTKIKQISKDQRSNGKSDFQIGEEKVLGGGSLASVMFRCAQHD